MRRSAILSIGRCAAVGLCLAGGLLPARAGDRSVTILEGVDEPPPAAAPLPADAAPLAPLHAANAAGLKVEILPNGLLPVGIRIAFSVSTQQAGYLVLVDINAEGRVSQIYPNVMSLPKTSANVATANLVKPGTAVVIPNPKDMLARFVFQADLPRGNGAIVAILCDKPVQIIDLPEFPTATGPQAIVDELAQAVGGLKIASADASGKFTDSTWSFSAAPYTIQ